MKEEIVDFIVSNDKIDRFINASNFGLNIPIYIHKDGIKRIMKSKKMKKYKHDNKKNDLFAFRIKDDYVLLTPETVSKIDYESSEDMEVLVDSTPYEIWFRREELKPFVENYNELIKKINDNKKKEAKIEMNKKYLKIFLYFIIGGVIILILLKMCKSVLSFIGY